MRRRKTNVIKSSKKQTTTIFYNLESTNGDSWRNQSQNQ